ncbi:hypothetical protein KKF34_04700 [Myxococcota bacterium]|nr:hypothetical protein [Myxococcota bacterium]MBU1379456.1 hypothetical protein [Myxococcota bacterium]MBU1496159.1 hypothetical protein [Myxococcota bacterium]
MSLKSIFLAFILLSSFSCTDVYVRRSKQGLALYSVPPLAAVYIDGKYIGIGNEVNARPKELSPGKHTILILDNRHYPYSSSFVLEKGVLLKRKIKVYPKLDE